MPAYCRWWRVESRWAGFSRTLNPRRARFRLVPKVFAHPYGREVGTRLRVDQEVIGGEWICEIRWLYMAERIDNPILNSPYELPTRHWKFDDDGITNETVDGRRRSEYFMPIPASKRRGGAQAELEFEEWTQDRVEENAFTNQARGAVERWRTLGWPGVTTTTRRLLEHWTAEDREKRLFFCQVEALETAIFLTEAASKQSGGSFFENEIRRFNEDANPGLYRVALKMATGTGKTVVMAMIVAWHTLNKAANPQDARFADEFLVVTPGITIRDRLRVLLPSDPNNYYSEWDVIPPERIDQLGRARIVITNFYAFKPREKRVAGQSLTKTHREGLRSHHLHDRRVRATAFSVS